MAVIFHRIDRSRGNVASAMATMSHPANKMMAVWGAIAQSTIRLRPLRPPASSCAERCTNRRL